MNARHEWKHEIRFADILALRSGLKAVMSPDPHAVNGRYEVRSLYFDSPADQAFLDKVNGVDRREKFRIRYYNGDPSFVVLEKKSKRNGLCTKVQERMFLGEARAASDGNLEKLAGCSRELMQELYCKMCCQGLRPKTIVDYTREPFIYEPGNVRVTLDYHIRTGIHCIDFLDPDCMMVPVRDAPMILEVKWDAFLPSVIREIIQIPGTHSAAFSKYAACRIYG